MPGDPLEEAVEAFKSAFECPTFDVASQPHAALRLAISAYLRVEAKSYPRMLPATSFRHPGFLLHELANKAAGLKDDEDDEHGE